MRLTSYTDYALRVLIFVGLKTDLATIAEISETYHISRNHLTKIVHDLGKRGYLHTVRGKHGGIRLARPAAEINVGEVVRVLEDDMNLVQCFNPATWGCCCIEPACMLRRILRDALDMFLRELDRYTLADLLLPGRDLTELLALNRPAPIPVSSH